MMPGHHVGTVGVPIVCVALVLPVVNTSLVAPVLVLVCFIVLAFLVLACFVGVDGRFHRFHLDAAGPLGDACRFARGRLRGATGGGLGRLPGRLGRGRLVEDMPPPRVSRGVATVVSD